jgi:hypothetical protein
MASRIRNARQPNRKVELTLWRFFCDDGENERRTDNMIFDAAVSGYMGLFGVDAGEDIVRMCRISRSRSIHLLPVAVPRS